MSLLSQKPPKIFKHKIQNQLSGSEMDNYNYAYKESQYKAKPVFSYNLIQKQTKKKTTYMEDRIVFFDNSTVSFS